MTGVMARPAHVPEELVRDFDLEFTGPVGDLFDRLDALRDECRAIWSTTAGANPYTGDVGGAWIFTRSEDIRAVFQDPERFSSSFLMSGMDDTPFARMIPLFLDPPEHGKYRRLLNPLFAPAVVGEMEDAIRGRIVALVDGVRDKGRCDFTREIAVEFPTRVFTEWLGLAEDQTPDFVALVNGILRGSLLENGDALMRAVAVLSELVASRTAEPRDDLISRIAAQQVDGRPLTSDELLNIAMLLFLAGLDTVAAALSFSFAHLAHSAADRRAVASHAVPTEHAVEELLRRHSFVNLGRRVTRDTELAGVHLKAGDQVRLIGSLVSRDPTDYEHPADVDFARTTIRQYAFGLGPHRCLGSHLARIELRLALDEWHARIPEYRIDGDTVAYGGAVMGLRSLPLRWD